MGIKAKLKAALKGADKSVGFKFPALTTHHFTKQAKDEPAADLAERFRLACKEQAEAIALIDAVEVLHALDVDARVVGTDMRLTSAAFGDLCHLNKYGKSGLPSRWCRELAKRDEDLALAVVREHIETHVPVANRQLVVDTRTDHVLGIVGRDTYHMIHHLEILELVMSLGTLFLSNAWLYGAMMRMTFLSDDLVFEPEPGDIVRAGMNCEHAINGDQRAHFTDYTERQVCTNGLVNRSKHHTQSVWHSDADIHYAVPKAIMATYLRSEGMGALIDAAAQLHLDDKGHQRVGLFVESKQQGGNPKLRLAATKTATEYAKMAGRDETDLTLWDFVNGVTEAAHSAPSLNRRTEIEDLGYRLMERFAAGA